MPIGKERPRSFLPDETRDSRTRDYGSLSDDSDGDEEPQQFLVGRDDRPLASMSMPEKLLLDNVSYALKARLAFSPYAYGAPTDAVMSYADAEPEGPLPDALAAAQATLQRAVLLRLRELQLLTEWPLLRPRCTAAQMERLLAGGVRASELVGVRSGPPLDFPRLPGPLQGLCLVGPADLAIALLTAAPAGAGPGGAGDRAAAAAQQAAQAATVVVQQIQQQIGKEWISLSQTGRGSGGVSSPGPGGAAGVPGASAAGPQGGGAGSGGNGGPGGTNGGSGGGEALGWVAGLPRSLGLLPGLPAVSSLPWAAPSLAQLRDFFRDLHPQQRHVGVDDRSLPWFRDVKVAAGRALAAEGGVRASAAFCVFGVPAGVRAAVWETALGLRRPGGRPAAAAVVFGPGGGGGGGAAGGGGGGGGAAETDAVAAFEGLCKQALEQPLLADVVVAEDVGPLVGNSEAFFLFEESVRAMLVAFLRDAAVAPRLAAPPLALLQSTNAVHAVLVPATPAQSPKRTDAAAAGGVAAASSPGCRPGSSGATGGGDLGLVASTGGGGGGGGAQPHLPYYPPNGVLPHRGLSLLAAPLCYMYEDAAASSYILFRAMYCRYWSKLHSLSAAGLPSPALPGLLRVFEGLMQDLDPQLVAHLSRLGLLAAVLVLPWITTAFAGALPVQEVLLLWDRVIGLDSLLPLPLLAAAILCFRRHVLLSCGSVAEVVAALSDVTQLRVVPLLQAVLFPGPGAEE